MAPNSLYKQNSTALCKQHRTVQKAQAIVTGNRTSCPSLLRLRAPIAGQLPLPGELQVPACPRRSVAWLLAPYEARRVGSSARLRLSELCAGALPTFGRRAGCRSLSLMQEPSAVLGEVSVGATLPPKPGADPSDFSFVPSPLEPQPCPGTR